MKKKFSILLMAALLLITVSGCGDNFNAKKIEMRDFYNKDTLEINLKIKKAIYHPDVIRFDRSESLNELKDIILDMNSETESYEVESFETCIFIKKKTDKAISYYYVKQLENGIKKYAITDMRVDINLEKKLTETNSVYILAPCQYLPEHEMPYSGFVENQKTEILCGFTQLAEFYSGLEKDSVLIDNQKQTIIVDALEIYSDGQVHNVIHNSIIKIQFETEDNKNFVTFTYVDSNN